MKHNILITGASIAGNALAFWLQRAGHDVTVQERAPAFREGGQSVDVRGVGSKLLERMGLRDSVAQLGTGERGIAFVDENNHVHGDFSQDKFGANGPTAELEILRGDLAHLLYDHAKAGATYAFGDSITALHDDGAGVDVQMQSGAQRRFDLVVAAEGIGSTTRRLVFSDTAQRRSFNLYMAYFTIPKGPKDSDTARWYTMAGGRSVFVRPDRFGTTRACFTVRHAPKGHEKLDTAAQKAAFHRWFADAAWETPRILAGMDAADDFYMEAVGQVLLPRWSQGRVALVGDAAWCASPISGMGTTLALVGAYVLAGELSRSPDHIEAFAHFEQVMRPFVKQAQGVSPLGPRMAHPSTSAGLAFYRAALRLMSSPRMQKITGKMISPPAENFVLPDYGILPISGVVET